MYLLKNRFKGIYARVRFQYRFGAPKSVGAVLSCALVFFYQYVRRNTKNFIQFANHF